ncbi:MAG: hypothetical protein GXO88_09430 [Chlorobi bacterium]|nr:hypothetical protein [Chlorobiota bacterium]
MKIAARSDNYQVLVNDEVVLLKQNFSGSRPIKIGKFIGASNCGLISSDEKYAFVGGYGLMVINIDNLLNNIEGNPKKSIRIYFRDENKKFWINKIWQDESGDEQTFCFASNLKQYCFNVNEASLYEIGSQALETKKTKTTA